MTSAAPASTVPGARRQPLGIDRILLAAAVIYLVCVGGTGGGELNPVLRGLTALITGALLVVAVLMAHRFTDRVDRLVVGALVCFVAAGVVAQFPRQALDATLTATGYAAAFLVARTVLARPGGRRMMEHVFIGLSIFFTLAAMGTWIPDLVLLWSLSDWEVVPALDLPLLSGGWGYRYDVALLVAILYPAWWAGRPSRLRRALAVPFGLLAVAAVFVTGSRALWLATAVASVLVGAPALVRLWRTHRTARLALSAALLGGALASVVLAEPIISRALTGTTLEYRFAQWGPLTELWLRHPVAGLGPGSFPWDLQLTPYFETSSWAPRHPDNAIFQLLPEAGVLGLAAVGLLTLALIPALWRGPSNAARWALATCAIVSIGANPTEVPFLVVPMVAWAAYGAPRAIDGTPPPASRAPRSAIAAASLGAMVLIGMGQASAWFGMLAYEDARRSAEDGEVETAADQLSAAIMLDPGMALYWRHRGFAWLLDDQPDRAVEDLVQATKLNPADGLSWRIRALAHRESGDLEAAIDAINESLRVQRSEPGTLLIAADLQPRAADSLLTEVVQAWPTIIGAPGWSNVADPGSTRELIRRAETRWAAERPSLVPLLFQDLWLAALSGEGSRPDTASLSAELADAYFAALRCSPDTSELLDEVGTADRRQGAYWQVRARDAANRGTDDPDAREALRIHTGDAPVSASEAMLNPLNEGVWWGYRRYPIFWPSSELDLPDWNAGMSRWTYDPGAAVVEAGLEEVLPDCVSSDG